MDSTVKDLKIGTHYFSMVEGVSWGSKPMKDSTDYLNPDEAMAIINNTNNLRDETLLLLLYKTGRRISELSGDKNTNSKGIMKSDINYADNLINFTILKKKPIKNKELTEKDRTELRKASEPYMMLMPVNSEVMARLKTYTESIDGEKLFDITRQRCHQILKEAAKRAGIEKRIHLHQFRHSFAICIAKIAKTPLDLEKLRELMGHSNIDTTRHYLKFAPEEETRQLVERL